MLKNNQFFDLKALITDFKDYAAQLDDILCSGKVSISNIPPWHQYYEIPMGQLFHKFINFTNIHLEVLEYIFADDPIKAALDIAKQDSPAVPPQNFDVGNFVALLYPLVKTYESVLYHQKTLHQLLKKIEQGHDTNDNLLQKVIQIDKTAIQCQVIQKRIQQAQFTGDEKFFGKIANALRPRLEPKYSQDADLTFMTILLMDVGEYQKMSESERFELLIQFKQPHIDDASFKRKLYRIKNLYVWQNLLQI